MLAEQQNRETLGVSVQSAGSSRRPAMKTKTSLIVVAAAVLGFALNTMAQQTVGNRADAEFDIEVTVDQSNNGVKFKCNEGCVWETLSFSCRPGVDCSSSIDERGTPAQ